jgi:CubicO group peptidase (beta-lactamase class C family)
MSFPDLLRTRIFEPLGMSDSAFWVPKEKIGRFGPAYTPDPNTGKRIVVDHPSTSRWVDPSSFPSGGAGLVSTVDDYLKFARVVLGRGQAGGVRLLSRKMFDLMATDHLTPEERQTPFLGMEFWGDQTFGLGLSIGTDVTKHEGLTSPGRLGWPGAYGTWWVADPAEDMIALMMIQLYFGNGSAIRSDCETMIYQAIED